MLAVLGWVGYQYFIVADAPDEVTTESALEQLSEDLAADESDTAAESDPSEDVATTDDSALVTDGDAGVIGTWTVDDDFGEFAFENASGSFAGFRVEKAMFVGGGQTAVGRSGNVTGTIAIGDGEVSAGEIIVDMTAIQSDISQREGAIADAVKADEFSTATFVITDGATLDTAALESGSTASAAIVGELTIAGATNTVTINAEATVAEAGIALVVGSTELVWADYDVETPTSSAGTVADDGILEFQLIVRLG